MNPIQPLKPQFKPTYELFTKEEIIERVRSEDNYINAKGYPLIKEVEGRLGKPIIELI